MASIDAARLVLANRRTGMLLSYRGHLYAKNRQRADKLYWRCSDKRAVFSCIPVWYLTFRERLSVSWRNPPITCIRPARCLFSIERCYARWLQLYRYVSVKVVEIMVMH